MSKDSKWNLSRRRLLGSAATIGAAGAIGGAATTSLLWDEEVFGNSTNPNVLQAGRLDLKVDYEAHYFNWIDDDEDGTIDNPDETNILPDTYNGAQIDQPMDHGLTISLTDLKPGDVIEKTISLHLQGNPGFLYSTAEIFTDSDADAQGQMPEPEDKVNGQTRDDQDGTTDGDLDDHLQCLVWLDGFDDGDGGSTIDPGNNLPDEISNIDTREDLVMTLGESQDPVGEGLVDTSADQFVVHGSFRDVVSGADSSATAGVDVTVGDAVGIADSDWPGLEGSGLLLDPDMYESVSGAEVEAEEYAGQDTYCFADSTTYYLGIVCWLPIDIPGVNDNVIQTDRVEYGFAFNAIQCRHNVANDGTPIDRTIAAADDDNNAQGLGS